MEIAVWVYNRYAKVSFLDNDSVKYMQIKQVKYSLEVNIHLTLVYSTSASIIVLCIKKQTKVYSNFLFIKSSRNNFIFLPVFYLVMFLMKAQKNFGKIAILKKGELVSLGGAKTHFGKIALK